MPLNSDDRLWLADFQRAHWLYLAGVEQGVRRTPNPSLERLLGRYLAQVQQAARELFLASVKLTEDGAP